MSDARRIESIELTAGQLEQLIVFERDSMTPAGSEISKAWFYQLRDKGLVARMQGNTVLTREGRSALERFRTMCRNLSIPELR